MAKLKLQIELYDLPEEIEGDLECSWFTQCLYQRDLALVNSVERLTR